MYIKGVGMTDFTVDTRNTFDIAHEAIAEALNDANMSLRDIDAVISSCKDLSTNGERQRHSASMLSSLLKKQIPIIRIPAGCAGGGQALFTALRTEFNNILVLGMERLVANTTSRVTDEILMGGERIYDQNEGMTFPCQNALIAQVYMGKYGATMDDLSLVALKNHNNGSLNPKARFFKKPTSLEEINGSQVIASPLRLFDCSTNANGAAACIVSRDKSDIMVAGAGMMADCLSIIERRDLTEWDATTAAAREAYEQAGLSAQDIDFAEVHDAFTPVELLSYEDLGFCRKGEAKNMIRDGETSINGKLPVNPSGGLKGKGHPLSATGIAQVYEIVKQMRKEAGNRQVSRAKTAICQNIGGAGSIATVHILKRTGV